MERHNAQQATGEERAVIIKCESFARLRQQCRRYSTSYHHSTLTLHGDNLGTAAVLNSIIVSAHEIDDPEL